MKKFHYSIYRVKCRVALSKSGLEEFEFSLNPYIGCGHMCIYCYSKNIMRYDGKEPWGSFVKIKENLPMLLRKELKRKNIRGKVGVGTVTDPYQPIEKECHITRACLKQLAKHNVPTFIQTKSSIILKDLNILKQFKEVTVAFTITTLNERIAELMEPGAPPISSRLEALEKLSNDGINCGVFISPIVPILSDIKYGVKDIIRESSIRGASFIYIDTLHLYEGIYQKMSSVIERFSKELHNEWMKTMKKRKIYYRILFDHLITEAKKYDMEIEFSKDFYI